MKKCILIERIVIQIYTFNYNITGRCADYIGMISSSEPQFTSIDELHNAVIKKPIVSNIVIVIVYVVGGTLMGVGGGGG